MPTDQQEHWQEISRYLDEALELDELARQGWLDDLSSRSPEIAKTLRSMLAERDRLDAEPWLGGEPLSAPLSGPIEQQLGAYTLDHVLGQGGMGTVWLAHRSDGRYEGRVAIKLLNASLLGRPTEQRFVREGSILAKLKHPNIAQLIDAGVAPSGQPYLVLEYVEGERIDNYAEKRKLSIEARIALFLEVLAAVSHAHSQLIVHRDLKPSNIMVAQDGKVKLLDFGIAALLGPDDPGLTREVDVGLTPEYAAPEQLLKMPITTATDVYALGLVLFLLMTRKHPFAPEGKSVPELAKLTLDHDPPRASNVAEVAISRMLKGDLDNIIAKALKKNPNERYQSADALAQDLRNVLAFQPVSARPDSYSYRARKFIRRHAAGVAIGTTLAAVLVGATVVTTLQMIEAKRQRDEALYQSRRAEFQARFAYHIMEEVGDDGPITIRDLMEKGVEVLEKNYADDPRFVIGMLVNISGRYMNLGDHNGEYAALSKAEALARKLGDPDRIAYVQCNTVETELALGKSEQARERLRDGLANLAALDEPSTERQTECGAAHARLLWAEGKLPQAIEEATKIAEMLESEGQTDDLMYSTLATMLDVMLLREGRHQEAREWNRRLIVALERSGNLSGLSLINARHNGAAHSYAAGEVRTAFDTQRDLVRRLSAQEGIENLPAGYVGRLGLYQVRLERTDAGLEWLDRAVQTATVRNDHAGRVAALMHRARANLWLQRYEDARGDIEQAESLASASEDENRIALRSLKFIRAELSYAEKHYEAALQSVEEVLRDIGYPENRVANQLDAMLTLRARLLLALGRDEDALQSVQDAQAIASANALDPSRSADVGAALLAMSEVHRARGEMSAARDAAQRAAMAFAASLGPDHRDKKLAETQAAAIQMTSSAR